MCALWEDVRAWLRTLTVCPDDFRRDLEMLPPVQLLCSVSLSHWSGMGIAVVPILTRALPAPHQGCWQRDSAQRLNKADQSKQEQVSVCCLMSVCSHVSELL